MLRSLTVLTRIDLCLMAVIPFAAMVLFYQSTVASSLHGALPLVGLLVLSFIGNDIYDLPADRKAQRTNKPLASGSISLQTAYLLWATIFLAGLTITPTPLLPVYLVITGVGLLYSPLAMALPLFKNVFATLLFLSAVWWFTAYYGLTPTFWVWLLLAGYFFARELHIDAYETKQDAATKGKTLAVLLGAPKAKRIGPLLLVFIASTSLAFLSTTPAHGLALFSIAVSVFITIRTPLHFPRTLSRWSMIAFLTALTLS